MGNRIEEGLKNEAFWILAALALWLIALAGNFSVHLAGAFLFCFLLCLRFSRRKLFLCILWLAVFSLFELSLALQKPNLEKPVAGEYSVVVLKAKYGIACKGSVRVVFYEPEEVGLGDKLYLSDFQSVHSLNNPGLFSFESYLHTQGIAYLADQKEVIQPRSFSLQGWVWDFIASRKASLLYRLLCYGITEDENLDWLSSLGLPLIALSSVLKTRLNRWFGRSIAGWILSGIQFSFLLLFPATTAALRVFLFGLAGNIFKTWSWRWPASVFLFLVFCPEYAGSLSLVLPAGLSFLGHFVLKNGHKKIMQIFWCAFCQILWMGKLNLLYLGMFLWLRTLLGWFFLLAIPGLFLEAYGLFLEDLLSKAVFSLNWCTVYGQAPFWYGAIAAGLILQLAWKWSRMKMAAALVVFCLYPFIWSLDPFFHVYQIDVGQGDAALIVEPFKKSAIMIDAAGRFNHDNAQELFIPFLQSRQIHQLTGLVLSHGDFDHDGAAESLSTNYSVKNIVRQGDESLDVNYDFHFLLQQRAADPEDENDQSQICLFGYDGFRYLYTGDASIHIEKQLLEQYDVQADILKLGHHGSDTSSCKEFLKAVNPRLALISSGFENRYGHPKLSVLKTMNELGIDRINTADHGAIHLMSLKNILIMQSADGLITFQLKRSD